MQTDVLFSLSISQAFKAKICKVHTLTNHNLSFLSYKSSLWIVRQTKIQTDQWPQLMILRKDRLIFARFSTHRAQEISTGVVVVGFLCVLLVLNLDLYLIGIITRSSHSSKAGEFIFNDLIWRDLDRNGYFTNDLPRAHSNHVSWLAKTNTKNSSSNNNLNNGMITSSAAV